jgi:hypothetical protein
VEQLECSTQTDVHSVGCSLADHYGTSPVQRAAFRNRHTAIHRRVRFDSYTSFDRWSEICCAKPAARVQPNGAPQPAALRRGERKSSMEVRRSSHRWCHEPLDLALPLRRCTAAFAALLLVAAAPRLSQIASHPYRHYLECLAPMGGAEVGKEQQEEMCNVVSVPGSRFSIGPKMVQRSLRERSRLGDQSVRLSRSRNRRQLLSSTHDVTSCGSGTSRTITDGIAATAEGSWGFICAVDICICGLHSVTSTSSEGRS